jgi:heterodisulfide reductase subunit A
LKQLKPEMEIFIVYRDMRTYGLRENLYREARAQGVVFIRYDFSQELEVSQGGGHLRVRFTNSALKREMEICPDLIVLASAVVPARENPISQLFKLPINEDGFFVEAHAKLRPVEFATEGIFMAGLAHYPKPVDESIAQAAAAASRAAVVLSQDEITAEGAVAHVNEMLCRGCGDCVEACPYSAIELVEQEAQKKVARVQEALCKGCGACTAACPTGADTIYHYDDQTMLNIVEAALEEL